MKCYEWGFCHSKRSGLHALREILRSMSREINAGMESEADTSALELFRERLLPGLSCRHTAPLSPEHTDTQLNDPGSQDHSLKPRLLQAGSTHLRLQLYMGLLHAIHHVKQKVYLMLKA